MELAIVESSSTHLRVSPNCSRTQQLILTRIVTPPNSLLSIDRARPAISGLNIFLLPGLLLLQRVALTVLSYGDRRKFVGFSRAL
ncbi:hypothetical protein IGI04_025679 [Brassica rapa subsp. trilocularis]|uniref:Uncharacterized protein n=1 Tax=Brassica rapa subsp. trilocularis TaxID=1813537 RepID=A0ABQ7KU23_BRACM|nr:hypothetical protein IGI04_025679 [Brassica rapa subsp. trilocularis]